MLKPQPRKQLQLPKRKYSHVIGNISAELNYSKLKVEDYNLTGKVHPPTSVDLLCCPPIAKSIMSSRRIFRVFLLITFFLVIASDFLIITPKLSLKHFDC